MIPADLLANLERRNVELWVEGDRLRFRAPQGVLSTEEREALASHRQDLIATLRARARENREIAPPSYNQRGLWFIDQTSAGGSAYHIACAARVVSAVNVDALRRSLQALVDRHESLRTTISMETGDLAQHIHGFMESQFAQIDASGWDDEAVQRAVREAYETPFDLSRGPLVRVHLYTRAPADHVLLLTVHHIAADGSSVWLLMEEWRALYQAELDGRSAALPRPSIRYVDYTRWQSELLAGSEGGKLWDYWKAQFSGQLPTLDLPTDYPRPPALKLTGATCTAQLPEDLSARVREFAREQESTPFVALLAAYCVLLARYTGQYDVVVGSPTLGRGRPEFERLIGDAISLVALRTRFGADTAFLDLMRHVREVVVGALEHQDFPFPQLIERLGVRRDLSRSPLVQVGFILQRPLRSSDLTGLFFGGGTADRIDFGGMALEPYEMSQQEGQFDLTLEVTDLAGGFGCSLRFSTELFEAETARRMLRHYEHILRSVVDRPSQAIADIELLTDRERDELARWNATHAPYDLEEGVEHIFETQVDRTPEAVAVVGVDRTLTYAELDARANQLAAFLRAQGVGPERLVGISLQRTTDLVVAVLGVLKAGGAYVPLDPAFPTQRLAFMVGDAQLDLLLTDGESEQALPEAPALRVRLDTDWPQIAAHSATRERSEARGNDRAYVLYTSGSTGKPKGVEVPRRALTNFLLSMQQRPGICRDDVLTAVTTLSFDIAGLELYLPLLCGARVVIAAREQTGDAGELGALLEASGTTIMQATPATWRMLIDSGWRGSGGLKALCGGEALPADLAAQLLERCDSVWNMYGPTETTVWSTLERVEPGKRITIGRPIANTRTYVLDERLRPVPVGIAGELCIGGEGVARGYLGRPELTAERFVPDRFASPSKARLYRTGDLARWRPDGRLECLGRIDHQVKVRGFRIELGEVEAALEQHDAVRQAVAAVYDDGSGDRRLVAYVVYHPGAEATASELRRFVRRELPEYMVPSLFSVVETLPLTPNGKIDRGALVPPIAQDRRKGERVAPRTATEQMLAAIWQDVLKISDVSVHDNFFDVGGHSLLSVQVVARLEKKLGLQFSPRLLVVETLEQLAARCDRHSNPSTATGMGDDMLKAVDRMMVRN